MGELNIRESNQETTTIDVESKDNNIIIEIVIRDEASTMIFREADLSDGGASLSEMKILTADFKTLHQYVFK